MHTEDKGTKNK